jgi:alpha-beta hydrolase superfamily lysophospholipase
VMDAAGVGKAVIVALSAGAVWALLLAARRPERVAGVVFVGPAIPFGPAPLERSLHSFDEVLDTDQEWAKYNRHYWLRDAITPHAWAVELAERTDGSLVTLEGSGHLPHARDPVQVNLLLRSFATSLQPPTSSTRRWSRGKARDKRALYISSPIGLGHAQRDVAIAEELRRLHPGLQVDWLTQHPVTAVLEANGERVHPASALPGE